MRFADKPRRTGLLSTGSGYLQPRIRSSISPDQINKPPTIDSHLFHSCNICLAPLIQTTLISNQISNVRYQISRIGSYGCSLGPTAKCTLCIGIANKISPQVRNQTNQAESEGGHQTSVGACRDIAFRRGGRRNWGWYSPQLSILILVS